MKSAARKYCKNCYYPISEYAKYCSQCAQKNTDGKIPVWQFLQDFISNLFNLDSKLFLTFFALLVPGKLTIEYFKGRHKSFANPVRMFLFAGIAMFALVITKTQNIKFDENDHVKDYERVRAKKIIENQIKTYQLQFLDSTNYNQTDSLIKWIKRDLRSSGADSTNIGIDKITIGNFITIKNKRRVSKEDLVNLTNEELIKKYQVEGWLNSLIFNQLLKVQKNGKGLLHYLFGKLPIMIFIMIPFFALFLKLFYIRRNFFYVEHLIFTFHYHTFAFLVIIVIMLLMNYLNGWLIAALTLLIFIYQFMAMRRVYQQGFLKTFIKFCALSYIYIHLAGFFAVLAAILSFLLF